MEELRQLIDYEIEALKNIPMNGSIEETVDLIYHFIHQEGEKLVVFGVEKAGHIGLQLSTTLCSTGTASCLLNPQEAQHGDLGLI